MEKESEAYKTIGEVAKIVGLINKKSLTLDDTTKYSVVNRSLKKEKIKDKIKKISKIIDELKKLKNG
jgi:hypothetical protein